MGHSHYWEGKVNDREKCARDIVRLLESSSVPLADGLATEGTSPIVDAESVWFNGVGDDGCETFSLVWDSTDFNFCKTGRRPYDIVVMAALCIGAYYGLSVSSDGDTKEWQPGLELARTIIPDCSMPVAS